MNIIINILVALGLIVVFIASIYFIWLGYEFIRPKINFKIPQNVSDFLYRINNFLDTLSLFLFISVIFGGVFSLFYIAASLITK